MQYRSIAIFIGIVLVGIYCFGQISSADDAPLPPATQDTVTFTVLQGNQEQKQVDDYLASQAYLRSVAQKRAAATAYGVWDRMADCETGGNWSMQGNKFSGGVGFANSTWNAFGGQQFASNAGLASREQQIIIAERVRASVGFRAWGCASRIGVG